MSLPTRGRPRSVAGGYYLRSDIIPPVRFSDEYPPVKPVRRSRNSAGMDSGILHVEERARARPQLAAQAGLVPVVSESQMLASTQTQTLAHAPGQIPTHMLTAVGTQE